MKNPNKLCEWYCGS